MNKEKIVELKNIRLKTILIAITLGLFSYIMIRRGPEIIRDLKDGKTPALFLDIRNGFLDGYSGKLPRY